MALNKKVLKSLDELKAHIKTHKASFYYSSQTSTVIPYDKIESFLPKDQEFYLCDLSQMPPKMELRQNHLVVSGAVNWKEARDFLKSKGRNIMTSPTEELALVTAGAATSCTGERCFAFGNLRSQIKRIKYLDFNGEEKELFSNKDIDLDLKNLTEYQQQYKQYESFKNAPYPRFEKEIDLMIGTEGQLGVITEIEVETVEDFAVNHMFLLLPKWEEDRRGHLEILQKIQKYRNEVILCELIDENAFSFLPKEDQPNQGKDAIFFEIKSDDFENFYEQFILNLENINQDEVFELSETKFHTIRASIPRAVFEENSRMGVIKMGTDVQVKPQDFSKLLDIYLDFTKLDIRYNLFGHFGDAHLHFNYMPKPKDVDKCQDKFEHMYAEVEKIKGSPFAEHGIGIIKQKYITNFWTPVQFNLFKELKDKFDPHNQFFPQGFMNLSQ